MHAKSHPTVWLLTPKLLTLGLVELVAAELGTGARLNGEALVVGKPGGDDWWAIVPASPGVEWLSLVPPELSSNYTYRITALGDSASPVLPRYLARDVSGGLLDPANRTYWTPQHGERRMRPATATRSGRHDAHAAAGRSAAHAASQPRAQAPGPSNAWMVSGGIGVVAVGGGIALWRGDWFLAPAVMLIAVGLALCVISYHMFSQRHRRARSTPRHAA